METIIIPVEENGKQLIRLEESIKSISSLMGAPVNTTIKAESLLDPEQKKLISQDFLMDQGSVKLEISILIKGDKAYITQNMGGSFGQYPVPMQEGMFTVFFSHNNLTVKHPAGRILYLEEPDEQGQWACRNREDKISFVKDDEGRVKFMIIHKQVHAPKINKK